MSGEIGDRRSVAFVQVVAGSQPADPHRAVVALPVRVELGSVGGRECAIEDLHFIERTGVKAAVSRSTGYPGGWPGGCTDRGMDFIADIAVPQAIAIDA